MWRRFSLLTPLVDVYKRQVLVGVVLAVLAAGSGVVRALLRPLMVTVKSIPVASFIILALLWLRNTGNLAVFISFLMVLPIVYTNTLTGIRQADAQLLELARLYRVPWGRTMRYIRLPAVLPPFRCLLYTSYSSGMVSRIAFAIATVTKPDVLIADEILSVGDFLFQEKCEKRMRELMSGGTTVIPVSYTHLR